MTVVIRAVVNRQNLSPKPPGCRLCLKNGSVDKCMMFSSVILPCFIFFFHVSVFFPFFPLGVNVFNTMHFPCTLTQGVVLFFFFFILIANQNPPRQILTIMKDSLPWASCFH